MMKKLIKLPVLLIILLLMLAACSSPEEGEDTPADAPDTTTEEVQEAEPEDTTDTTEEEVGEPYKIGVFFSATGPASSLGVPERDTALMIAEQVNAAGGIEGPDGLMHPLELIIEDDQTSADEALLIVKRFIEQENVPVIVGGTASGISLAVIDTVTEGQVPFISNASSSAIIEPVAEREWIFKTPQTNLPVAQVQGDWMVAKGITQIASFGVNNGFGVDSMGALQTVAADLGVDIVWEGTFEPADTDFSAQLTQIAGSGAQALIVHATPAEGAPLTVQFNDLALGIPIMQNHGIGNQAFIDLAGDAANGVLFPIGKLLVVDDLPATDPQKGVLTQYISDYTDYTNGATPSTFGGHAWDSMQMAIMALSEVGPDAAAIRDYLEGIQNFAGISGVFNLSDQDHNGIGKETLVLVEIKDGGWEYVPPALYESAPTGLAEREVGEPYKIGIFFSATGPASSLGVPERDTALMLVDQVNESGGLLGPDGKLHMIEAIIEDDQTSADEALLIVKRLIEQENVPIIVGGTASGISLAVIDTVTEAEVPFISNASSSAIIQPVEERAWIFKTPQTNLPVAQVQGDWMLANGITQIASFGVNNGFGVDSMGALQTVAAEMGVEIVWEGTFEPADTDFSAQLTQIAGSGAEALIVHSTPAEGAPLTVQFRDLGLEFPILHNHGIGNQAFIDLAGDAAEGVMFPIGKLLVADGLPDTDPQKVVLLQYMVDYGEFTGGATPSTFGGHAWDAMQMTFSALQAVGPDAAAIRDYLEGIQNFAGISGIFNLSDADHNGIGKESLVLVEIKDGTWIYVDPDSYTSAPSN
ncbi:MAG: ABC transporter substrate-binding protein [Chloroflexi bacterium]|nr:ABC transporter substrate-binding protein [Chloroflexota bacterium]